MQYVKDHVQNVADSPIQNRASPTASDHGATFLNTDDDTDSDIEIQSDPHEMRSPSVLEETRKRHSGSARKLNDTNSSIWAMELPRHALIKVKAWTEDPRLNIIWIEGTSPFFPRSKDNLPSWKPYQNTTSSPPRYIFASCNPKSTSSTDSQLHERRSNEELALLCLLDSIIAQLQEIFPSLYLDRPESIDRSNESADVALRIIQAFLEEDKVPSLVWVIDGLQFTESASTNPFLIKLVKSLRFRGYKICLTTQGTSRVLSQVTWDYEQVKASNSMWKNGGYT